MKRIRIQPPRTRPEPSWREDVPLDPRDPDVGPGQGARPCCALDQELMGQAVQAPAGSSQAVPTPCLAWRRLIGPGLPGSAWAVVPPGRTDM